MYKYWWLWLGIALCGLALFVYGFSLLVDRNADRITVLYPFKQANQLSEKFSIDRIQATLSFNFLRCTHIPLSQFVGVLMVLNP
jgi:hypothetical protein